MEDFIRTVRTYYAANRRQFPWRETRDPYAITVSEIMLQQTQADRVIKPYQAFLHTFPTWRSLAAADLKDVLILWKGLGYNRRAVNLKRIAETIVREHGGTLPQSKEELLALPGIGPATAGDIRAFAWNMPDTIIETNIRSVFIHHFFSETTDPVHDKDILPLIEQALDKDNPRDWYYALMDYGAMLKKTYKNPSRKSAHHVRQSPYKGSRRELRARILFALTESPETRQSLSALLERDLLEIEHVLSILKAEGVIVEKDRTWYIN